VAAGLPADVPARHLVAQPAAGAGNNPHMFGHQADLLVQLAEHRLLGCFAAVDAPLRELPGVGAYPLAPEHLVLLVEQDDADVGPKAVPVKHNQTPILKLSSLCTAHRSAAIGSAAVCPLINPNESLPVPHHHAEGSPRRR